MSEEECEKIAGTAGWRRDGKFAGYVWHPDRAVLYETWQECRAAEDRHWRQGKDDE
jgi:hypothetical protein